MLKKLSVILIGTIYACTISAGVNAGSFTGKKSNFLCDMKNQGHHLFMKPNIKKRDTASCKTHILKDQQLKVKLEKYMDAAAKYNNFQGAVLVEKDGKVIISRGYGMADYENVIPNKSSTRFAIGSITKQFTAMTVMQLCERDKLKLEDKLSKYYPDFPRGNEITIHQLLTHTSGLANYTMFPELWEINPKDITKEDLIKLLYNYPLDFNPGERWNYSNSGYLLLGDIVEKVTGMSQLEFMNKNIFKPLKMKNTGTCMSGDKLNLSTKGYAGYLDIQPVDDTLSFKAAFGAGYMFSTVEDLYLWERALETEKLVSKKTMAKIFTPYAETFMGSYGYGWFIKGEDKERTVFHDGIVSGFHALISKYVGINSASIILSNKNINGSTVYRIESDINNILLGKDVEMPKEKIAVKLDDEKIERLLGTYEIEPGLEIEVTREEAKIYAVLTGMEKMEIFPQSETEAFLRSMDLTVQFHIDENNKADSITIDLRGIIYNAVRKA